LRCFVIGLVVGALFLQSRQQLPTHPAWAWVTLALLAFTFAILIYARSTKSTLRIVMSSICWLICGVLLGLGYAQHRAEVRLSDELAQAWEGRDIAIIGAVSSLPTVTERGVRFQIEVEDILTAGAVIPRHISLNWYTELNRKTNESTLPPTLTPGERWQLSVRLRRPHGSANPHGFDFEAYALERNIRATGYVRPKGENKKLAKDATGAMFAINKVRLLIRERMMEALGDSPHAGVLVALAVGEQNAIPANQWKTFWRTGTGHLMSISGLHITMVAGLIYWLSFYAWARLPQLASRIPAQRVAAIAGALAALAYSLIAGFSVPTQRTFFMLLVVALALMLGRGLSATRILALAVFAVVLIDPWCVLAPGFWLSFGAVAMIFYVMSNRPGRLNVWVTAYKTQLAVTLGLLPLTLLLFQEVSIISPIANALAIPIVSWVVVPVTLIGVLLPFDFMLHAAHLVMQLTYACLAWLADLPSAVWQSHAPQAWTVVVAMIGAAMLLLPRGIRSRWVGFILLLPMFFILPAAPKPGEVWLTLLDVGQGLATIVRTTNYTMLYDAGPKWSEDVDSGNRIVVPYLRGEGIRALDAIIVTHDDEDHTGGARSVIDVRHPKWVMTSAPMNSEYLANANEKMRCEVGDGWRWDGVEFDVIHPTAADYDAGTKTNNLSCVIKITAPGGSILLTADIEKIVEANLVERAKADLKSDVLIVPHHGSKTSSTDEFLDAVAPALALIPVGYRNRFRHPHPSVEARYKARNIAIHRTDWDGAITLKFDVNASGKPSIDTHRATHKRYWTNTPERGEVRE
jgi:competence protein ComEC